MAEVQCGGPEYLGWTPKDSRNLIERRRHLRFGDGNVDAISKLFIRLQNTNREFVYHMDINDHSRLVSVMWVDSRSGAAHEEFSDAITFDTTYLINKYKIPFATVVVGINHHSQSILLGCALIGREDANSFKWLFRHWLAAMGKVHPKCIITDQCESIKIAIQDVMPNMIHRYCVWHITNKLPTKLNDRPDYHDTANAFRRIFYESITPETFEVKWAEFLETYALQNHRWYQSLYGERTCWVPCYLNQR